jgi:hypothetical protein
MVRLHAPTRRSEQRPRNQRLLTNKLLDVRAQSSDRGDDGHGGAYRLLLQRDSFL